MAQFDYKAEITKLEEAIDLKQISPGGALAMLALKMHDHFAALQGCPTVARVSFRKNVEIAPFKHEHAEVSVECNGASLAEAAQLAKDAVDEVLGVKELRTAQEQIENAKKVLRDAAKRQRGARKMSDKWVSDLERSPATWGDDDDFS